MESRNLSTHTRYILDQLIQNESVRPCLLPNLRKFRREASSPSASGSSLEDRTRRSVERNQPPTQQYSRTHARLQLRIVRLKGRTMLNRCQTRRSAQHSRHVAFCFLSPGSSQPGAAYICERTPKALYTYTNTPPHSRPTPRARARSVRLFVASRSRVESTVLIKLYIPHVGFREIDWGSREDL